MRRLFKKFISSPRMHIWKPQKRKYAQFNGHVGVCVPYHHLWESRHHIFWTDTGLRVHARRCFVCSMWDECPGTILTSCFSPSARQK